MKKGTNNQARDDVAAALTLAAGAYARATAHETGPSTGSSGSLGSFEVAKTVDPTALVPTLDRLIGQAMGGCAAAPVSSATSTGASSAAQLGGSKPIISCRSTVRCAVDDLSNLADPVSAVPPRGQAS